jgi:hypothetical protein
MALVEKLGNVLVHGRFGDLQVGQDGFDTQVLAPASSTHAEVHQESQFQRIFYSLTGAATTLRPLPPGAKDEGGSPFRVALGAATSIFFRKARQIRQISFRPGLSGHFRGNFQATAGVPALSDSEGVEKDYFFVIEAGTYDFGAGGIVLVIGDWVIYDGTNWIKATSDPRADLCDDVIGKLTVTFTED